MEGKESLVPAFAIKVSTGPGRTYKKRCFFHSSSASARCQVNILDAMVRPA